MVSGAPLETSSLSLAQAREPGPRATRTLGPFPVRWARKDAHFCVPIPPERHGYLLVLQCPAGEGGAPVPIGLASDAGGQIPSRHVPTGKWTWCVWPVRDLGVKSAAWLTINSGAAPAANADDAVAGIGQIVVLE